MLTTNENYLVRLSVIGEISDPIYVPLPGFDGVVRTIPGIGGITYNVKTGDSAFDWVGDHIEAGVSTRNKDPKANNGYNTFACVGNTAYVVSGDAKGAKGIVTGKHGGIDHVIIHFDAETLEKLQIGEKIQVHSLGQGLALVDYPGITCMNLDPTLLHKMGLVERTGVLEVPVAYFIPPEFMGSGLGKTSATSGDYDMTTMNMERVHELELDQLRLGDIVAIENSSALYGWSYQRGAVIIGVVVHGNSYYSGHGPGITTLLTCLDGKLKPMKAKSANIAEYLQLV